MKVLAGLVAVALLVVVIEDSTRLLAYLPWLLLAACPLMHMFLHRGHGHRQRGHARHEADPTAATMRDPHHLAGGES